MGCENQQTQLGGTTVDGDGEEHGWSGRIPSPPIFSSSLEILLSDGFDIGSMNFGIPSGWYSTLLSFAAQVCSTASETKRPRP